MKIRYNEDGPTPEAPPEGGDGGDDGGSTEE